MRKQVMMALVLAATGMSANARSAEWDLGEAANPPAPPATAVGYPSRAADLDALPGFRDPPPGYGEVPFWWWTGDPLDKDRLLWQIDQLHEKGISGMQVNYAHADTPGWPTYRAEPELFSDEWWEMWKFVAGQCSQRGMGIGLSGYTIDWPNGKSPISRTIYSDPEIQGRELAVANKTRAEKGRADLIKGKVSSSIAQLYRRPRVWLEGYHSLGWGATPERLMQATCENYLYGCNLLNLHGLYYTTHGSFWEWAPPSYHFRMPYWEHMDVFFKYFERLSYLMSQGVHQCDVAIMYPVSPGQVQLGGREATGTAFNAGAKLFQNGYDFIFMDFESLARAQVRDGRLHVSDASYGVLVLPAMRAVRWSTLEKARQFFRQGGIVIAVGALPEASDRAGRNDPVVDEAVKEILGATAAEAQAGARPPVQTNPTGGIGIAITNVHEAHVGDSPRDELTALLEHVAKRIPRDVQSSQPIKATHRKIGPRDVYLVMGAAENSTVEFRAKGRVELWDPWSGAVRRLRVIDKTKTGTCVELPLENYEAQIVVFTPTVVRGSPDPVYQSTARSQESGRPAVADSGEVGRPAPSTQPAPNQELALDGDWEFELKPTMDNRYGDFRLPATDKIIGPEARIFRHAVETGDAAGWHEPSFDDTTWERVTYGFGPQFWLLGPLPADADCNALDTELAKLTRVNAQESVNVAGKSFCWRPYRMS